jgi:intein/homing endonuclease
MLEHIRACLEMYILGLFFGDGWFEKCGIAIATKDEDRAIAIANAIKSLYNKVPSLKLKIYHDGHKVWWIRLWSSEIAERYAKLLHANRCKSLNATPPREVFEKNRDLEICFIAGVIDAEGWIYKWRGRLRISIEMYNEEMSKFVVQSLKSRGIKCSLSKCKDGAYRIDITGSHALTFIKIIPKYLPAAIPRRVPAVNDAG